MIYIVSYFINDYEIRRAYDDSAKAVSRYNYLASKFHKPTIEVIAAS